MVIDIHTHAFDDNIAEKALSILTKTGMENHHDGTLQQLKESMRRSRIDKSVILPVATKPTQTSMINQWAIKVQNENTDIISFGTVHPMNDDYKEIIKDLKHSGIKGIKFHPMYQEFNLNDVRMMNIFYRAADEGLILMFHAGLDLMDSPYAADPKSLLDLIKRLRGAKIIAAHMGGFKQWNEAEAYLIGQDIYIDTSLACSFMDINQIKRMMKNHGFERILFGSDSPWDDPIKALNLIKRLNLKKNDECNLLYNNALTILNQK